MGSGPIRFGRFALDLRDRRLRRDGAPIELNSRYFDALALLVAEQGRLVSKDRFLGEVWRGVPVTDEALTQCIRSLRKALGDDAATPRFIETVPKHGYRFIAPVEGSEAQSDAAESGRTDWRGALVMAGGGVAGGGVAGLVGGLFYGSAAAAASPIGALSTLLVVLVATVLLGLAGAAGIALGIALGSLAPTARPAWTMLGAAAGGLVVGSIGRLVGTDAFNLLLGTAPESVTGAAEGAALGIAAGAGALAAARLPLRRAVAVAGAAGGVAGLAIVLLGGRLLGGTFDTLSRQLPGSNLRLDAVGALFGETGLGPLARAVTGAAEGAVFVAALVAAMTLAVSGRRSPSG
jgi:DNA-binding winged helix-turn-helix (wHTH) protein